MSNVYPLHPVLCPLQWGSIWCCLPWSLFPTNVLPHSWCWIPGAARQASALPASKSQRERVLCNSFCFMSTTLKCGLENGTWGPYWNLPATCEQSLFVKWGHNVHVDYQWCKSLAQSPTAKLVRACGMEAFCIRDLDSKGRRGPLLAVNPSGEVLVQPTTTELENGCPNTCLLGKMSDFCACSELC